MCTMLMLSVWKISRLHTRVDDGKTSADDDLLRNVSSHDDDIALITSNNFLLYISNLFIAMMTSRFR